jgi:hypothetical protein
MKPAMEAGLKSWSKRIAQRKTASSRWIAVKIPAAVCRFIVLSNRKCVCIHFQC